MSDREDQERKIEEAGRRAEEAARRAEEASRKAEEIAKRERTGGPGEPETYGQGRQGDGD